MISCYISSLINTVCVIYIIKKLLQVELDIKNKRTIIIILIMSFLIFINYFFFYNYLRIILSTTIIIVCSKFIFNKKIDSIISVTIIEQINFFLAELILALFLTFISTFKEIIFIDTKGNLLTNILICLLSVLLINSSYLKKAYIKLIEIIYLIKKNDKYIISFIFFASMNILILLLYYNINNTNNILMITSIFLICFYSIMIFMLLNEKNKNVIVSQRNEFLINNLNEYEKMLDYQRVNNHENKNQLLVIKSMIEKKDKKLLEYLNEIINEKREDDEIVYNKAKRIPSGGLQGLIYQKMLLMQEKNIEVNLDINSKVRKIDFGNLSSKMNYDICRIVGIIIDNAIEETIKFNKKEREIIISMYVDGLFIIEVSNRIKADIDLSKIYEKGYTNKEKGHGYGLSLLKKIVDENDNIINEVKIVNNIFTQVIKIKM